MCNGESNSRRTACHVLKELNKIYIDDPNFVNIIHCHTMASLGVKHGLTECEFLMGLVDLINSLGVETTVGEAFHKFLPHFVKSVEKNLKNEMDLSASITILTVLANMAGEEFKKVLLDNREKVLKQMGVL